MPSNAPTPCVIYAAKSTQDRHKSIPTQIEDCRAMAGREGWDVVGDPERFRDEGFSAYSGNRGPGLERAKRAAAEAAAERGTTAVLVVQHSDRLARGAGDRPGAADSLVEIWHAMRRADVHLRSVQNDPMLSDPLLVAAASKLAFEESKRKSDAIKSGKRRRAEERGETNGALAFGYRFENPDAKVRVRVPDPNEAAAWLRMREMLREGKTLGAIARWLNSRGVRSKRGNAFSAQRVRDLLANPYYAGKVRLPDGGLAEGVHDPLVTWDEHQAIVRELGALWRPASSRPGRRPTRPTLLGGGLMRCAHCGRGVWQRHHESGKREYMCASVRQKTGTCDAAPFDAPTVEGAVLDHLDGLFVDLGAWIDRMAADRADGLASVEAEAAALMRERESLERDEALVRADYMRQVRAGRDGAAAVAAAEVARIEGERAALGATVADVEARLAKWDGGGDHADAVLDWWAEFSAAIRGEVVGARTVAEANAALKERFAAIFVRSPDGGGPRLDFVLADRPPGAPLVSSRLWADAGRPDDGSALIDFVTSGEPAAAGDKGRKTFVAL